MSQLRRDWSDARAKVDSEARCRVCGRNGPLEAAHISGRKFDQPKTPGSKTLYVHPDDIVPLCGAREARLVSELPERGCHELFDAHQLDLLPFLSPAEQVKVVQNFQSIESARRRLCPNDFKKTP